MAPGAPLSSLPLAALADTAQSPCLLPRPAPRPRPIFIFSCPGPGVRGPRGGCGTPPRTLGLVSQENASPAWVAQLAESNRLFRVAQLRPWPEWVNSPGVIFPVDLKPVCLLVFNSLPRLSFCNTASGHLRGVPAATCTSRARAACQLPCQCCAVGANGTHSVEMGKRRHRA